MIRAKSIGQSILVNDERRFIYLKVPKNACSTTVLRLWMAAHAAGDAPEADPKRVHTTAVPIWTGKPCSIDDPSYFRFAVARNPFTRVLSCYLNIITKRDHPIRIEYNMATKTKRETDVSFLGFLKGINGLDGENDNRHWRPQFLTMFFDYVDVQYIGHFEIFEESMSVLLERLYGTHAATVRSSMRGHRTDAHEKVEVYYSQEALDLVRRKYRRDFELFGYNQVDPTSYEPCRSPKLRNSGQHSADLHFRNALSEHLSKRTVSRPVE